MEFAWAVLHAMLLTAGAACSQACMRGLEAVGRLGGIGGALTRYMNGMNTASRSLCSDVTRPPHAL
jgi:hypothetical protein